MTTVSEDEAKTLLAATSYCDDCQLWRPDRGNPKKWVVQGGLADAAGQRTGLTVELKYHAGGKAGRPDYVFTVFSRRVYGSDRVYQLDVRQGWKPGKTGHRSPHEHYGDARITGLDGCLKWSYDELLRYFSTRTNIVFRPPPPDPGMLAGAKR